MLLIPKDVLLSLLSSVARIIAEDVGGLFCSSCTLQRMVLRGQGDSPVRICDPCINLEEAVPFDMRHAYRSRTGRGSTKSIYKNEDEVSNQILGIEGLEASNGMVPGSQGEISTGACSNTQEVVIQGEVLQLAGPMI